MEPRFSFGAQTSAENGVLSCQERHRCSWIRDGPGYNGRDGNGIAAAAKSAGVGKIDFVLITHFHKNHGGGITQLAAKIPLGRNAASWIAL